MFRSSEVLHLKEIQFYERGVLFDYQMFRGKDEKIEFLPLKLLNKE